MAASPHTKCAGRGLHVQNDTSQGRQTQKLYFPRRISTTFGVAPELTGFCRADLGQSTMLVFQENIHSVQTKLRQLGEDCSLTTEKLSKLPLEWSNPFQLTSPIYFSFLRYKNIKYKNIKYRYKNIKYINIKCHLYFTSE